MSLLVYYSLILLFLLPLASSCASPLAPERTAVVQGVITDASGKAVQATVRLLPFGHPQDDFSVSLACSTHSSTEGVFVCDKLPLGAFILSVVYTSSSGHEDEVFYPGVPSLDDTSPITIARANARIVADVIIHAHKGAVVTGGFRSRPLGSKADLEQISADASAEYPHRFTLGVSGTTFRLSSLAHGRYRVTIHTLEVDGGHDYTSSFVVTDDVGTIPITLVEECVKTAVVSIGGGSKSNPRADLIELTSVATDVSRRYEASIDSRGLATFQDLKSGRYHVLITGASDFGVASVVNDDRDTGFPGINLAFCTQSWNFSVDVDGNAGRVILESMLSPAISTFSLKATDDNLIFTNPLYSDKEITFPSVPPGEYTLRVGNTQIEALCSRTVQINVHKQETVRLALSDVPESCVQ